jgi:hypothetical protein
MVTAERSIRTQGWREDVEAQRNRVLVAMPKKGKLIAILLKHRFSTRLIQLGNQLGDG